MAATEKRKRGVQLTLTRAMAKRICAHVATGTPKTIAAAAEGVADNTVEEWIRRGEGRDERPATPLLAEFAKAIRKAEAQDVNRRKVRLEKAAELDPALAVKVDTWWLERRHPEEFAPPNQRVEVTGEGGGAVKVELAYDPTLMVAAVAARLAITNGKRDAIDVEAEEIT